MKKLTKGSGDASLYEMFFDIEVNLCERFPALTPFKIRQQRAYEVFLLINRLNNYTASKNKEQKTINTDNNKKVIRRVAADDTWY